MYVYMYVCMPVFLYLCVGLHRYDTLPDRLVGSQYGPPDILGRIPVLSTFLSNDDLLTPVLGNFSQFVASLSVNLPNNFIYGIVVVGSLIIVQIPILKKRLDSN